MLTIFFLWHNFSHSHCITMINSDCVAFFWEFQCKGVVAGFSRLNIYMYIKYKKNVVKQILIRN